MDCVIRAGALRLLTAESSCDVILSCQGHRLMAHKLILSMASPVFRGLLLEECSDPTVVILPDINGNIMSLLLDYIYTGSVVVYSNTIHDFIGVASLLKIQIDLEYSDRLSSSRGDIYRKAQFRFDEDVVNKKEEVPYQEKVESLDVVSSSNPEVYSKKNQRKLPNLVPINAIQTQKLRQTQRKLCSYIVPSPWCPRVERVFGDPRNDGMENLESGGVHPFVAKQFEANDSNNNLQIQPIQKTATNYKKPNKLNEAISSLHQKSKENHRITKLPKFELFPIKNLAIGDARSVPKILDPLLKVKTTKTVTKPDEEEVETSRGGDLKKSAKNNVIKGATEKIKIFTQRVLPTDTSKDNSLNIPTNDGSQTERDCKESKKESKNNREKPFKCEDCSKSFSQLRNYKYHRSVHEGTKEFAAKCPECGKVFNDRGYLSSHLKIHRDKKEYACPHCPKRFNQRVAYNMHLRIHTGVKPHECSVCGKSFSRKMLLKQHQRVHTGERPYSCPECGKTFADRSNMSLHARLHTGVKPYACTLCPKSFTKKHHLKTHMNFHTGLKPYNCQKCGLAFSQSSNMRTHYKKCILKNGSPVSSSSEMQRDSS